MANQDDDSNLIQDGVFKGTSKGEAALFKSSLLLPIKYIRKQGRYLTGLFYDKRFNIKTTNIGHDAFLHQNFAHDGAAWPERKEKPINEDATYAIPLGYHNLVYGRLALGGLSDQDVVMDMGCGAGRAVFYFAHTRVKRVRGLEYDSEAFEQLKANQASTSLKKEIEVSQGDAAQHTFTDETILYMYNPFGDKTMEAVLDNLHASLKANPRNFRILYFRPTQHDVLVKRPWIEQATKSLPIPFILMPFTVYKVNLDKI